MAATLAAEAHAEPYKRAGWRRYGILVVAERDPRFIWSEREQIRQLGARLAWPPQGCAGGRAASSEAQTEELATFGGRVASPPALTIRARGAGRSAELPRRELEEVRELDPDGRIVVHGRLVDSLGRMRRSETIDRAMYDAARAFQAAFTIANLDPIRAAAILRVPGTGPEPDLNERQLDARRRVHAAMQALGGINSPAGSCVWHVVGCGAASASGPSVEAGVDGRCGRNRLRGS